MTSTSIQPTIITEYYNVFRVIKYECEYEYGGVCVYKFTCCKKNMIITTRGYEIMKVKFNDFQIDIGDYGDKYNALLEYVKEQIGNKIIGNTSIFKCAEEYSEAQLITDVSDILRTKLNI